MALDFSLLRKPQISMKAGFHYAITQMAVPWPNSRFLPAIEKGLTGGLFRKSREGSVDVHLSIARHITPLKEVGFLAAGVRIAFAVEVDKRGLILDA